MKNKKLIELITELKQQLDESRDTDFDNYVGKLSKRASKVISELEGNNVVLYDVTPRLIFDEGIKYVLECAEKEDKDIDLDVIGMIAKDYTRHVAHYIRNNGL
tara:strand:+ start:1449 stop:1757 length:309 start_codon:yes stop_codon:yes gene_type:complete